MLPVQFKGANKVFGAGQPEYIPLPALQCEDEATTVISCWEMNWYERLRVLFTGRLWLAQMRFATPLQPILPMVEEPPEVVEARWLAP